MLLPVNAQAEAGNDMAVTIHAVDRTACLPCEQVNCLTPTPLLVRSVETRWDIVPRGEGGCHVTMRAKVPFSKATMWKK